MNRKYLKDLAEIQTGSFGSQLHKEDYAANGTPIATVEHLGNKVFSEQNLPHVSEADKSRLSKYVLKTGDIVFSRVGSVDRRSFVEPQHEGWIFSGRRLRVRPRDQINPLFLYYYFNLEETKFFIRNIAVGSTMPSINTKLLGTVEIVYPKLEVQERIASILASIDERIALNALVNKRKERVFKVKNAFLTQFRSLLKKKKRRRFPQ